MKDGKYVVVLGATKNVEIIGPFTAPESAAKCEENIADSRPRAVKKLESPMKWKAQNVARGSARTLAASVITPREKFKREHGREPTAEEMKRGTGRTTRMVQHAIAIAKQRTRIVFIVGHDVGHIEAVVAREGGGPLMDDNGGVRWLRVRSAGNCDFGSRGPQVRGRSDSVVFVDHYVIEQRFGFYLAMMQAYDEGAPPPQLVDETGASLHEKLDVIPGTHRDPFNPFIIG